MLGKKGEIGAGGIQVITSQGFGVIMSYPSCILRRRCLLNLVSLGELFDKLESTTKRISTVSPSICMFFCHVFFFRVNFVVGKFPCYVEGPYMDGTRWQANW